MCTRSLSCSLPQSSGTLLDESSANRKSRHSVPVLVSVGFGILCALLRRCVLGPLVMH
jgi:hypothetical protein